MPSRKSTRNPRRYHRRRNCIFNSRRRHQQQQQRQQQQQQQQQQMQRGGADATSLSSILPANSFYPYNANTLPNPVDVRAQPMQQQQQQQQQQPPVYTQMHAHMQGGRRRRSYAGKQVGCRTRHRSKSRSKSRTRHGYRSRSQSGGDSISYLPSDANMLLRSATTFAGNLVSGLKGEPGSPSPLPFEDHSIQKPRSL